MSQGLELPVGYHIRYIHYRFYMDNRKQSMMMAPYRRGESKWHRGPFPRGGKTIASIYNPEGDVIAGGQADCSLADGFDYKLGMAISRGRALKKLREMAVREKGKGVLPRGSFETGYKMSEPDIDYITSIGALK